MKITNLIIILLNIILSYQPISAQNVGIGTNAPKAALEISSTTNGFLPPRMSFVQRNAISNPSQGLMIYCTDCGDSTGQPQYFNGRRWCNLMGDAAAGQFVMVSNSIVTKTIVVPFDPSGNSPFTLFRFRDSSVVANIDSASNNWDFGLRFTTFIVNSHAGGPGNAGVILQNGTFDSITSAPTSGYAYDTTVSSRAIKDGSWYMYSPVTHGFTPTPGKIFLFRTGDGYHYAKMELLSVDYAPFTGMQPTHLLYTFRFIYQPNGSTNFY